jgi:hypothetical protein
MRTRTLLTTLAIGTIALTPLGARAQDGPAGGGALTSASVFPRGFGLQLGAGVTGFSRKATRDLFGTGGYWDARAVVGSRSFVGAELAYVGSVRGASGAGLGDEATLSGDGVEAAVRANLPLRAGGVRVEPFAFGGVGKTLFQVVSEVPGAGIKDRAGALTVPFGAGISASQDYFIIDARFTYRRVFDDEMVPLAGGRGHADLQSWAAGLTVGFEI